MRASCCAVVLVLWVTGCGNDGLSERNGSPPVVNAGPAKWSPPNELVSFTGSAMPSAGHQIVTWEWAFGDDTIAHTQDAVHAYSTVGTYTVTLTATDNVGLKGSGTTTVTISTQAPLMPVITGPTMATVSMPITLSGAMSTPLSAISGWRWDFGDGSTGSGEMATHSFAAAGTFNVTLAVRDAQGDTATSNAYPIRVMAEMMTVDAGMPEMDAGMPEVDAGCASDTLPASSGWSYESTDPSDMGCGGFGTGPLTIQVTGTSITVTESDPGLGNTVYTGTYDPTTRAWSAQSSVPGLGGSQGFNCTFSCDFMTFTGNYFVTIPALSCSAMVPVAGTRT